MRRLCRAPNLALATLWSDMLRQAGFDTSVQRAYATSIAGEIPPDQCLPEIWIDDDDDLGQATRTLHELKHPPHRRWVCTSCGERIDGPFGQCWRCGADAPDLPN